jgi:hypothetical protein
MGRGHWTVLYVSLSVVAVLCPGSWAQGFDTEQQLLARLQSEQNPVKKAKDEIKLSKLKLIQVHDAYVQGHVEEGTKLLGTFLDEIKTSWKLLQDSGRKASRQPEGFRELEIALREDVRALHDLGPTVSYFDRGPLLNAEKELDQMRIEVLNELFPGGKGHKNPAAPPTTNSAEKPPRAQ